MAIEDTDEYKAGIVEGKATEQKRLMDILEHEWMEADTRPDRGSPEAQFMLDLISRISRRVREG